MEPLEPPTCRTLIVDDDRRSKTALAALLEQHGYHVKAVETLGGAFGTYIKWRPQCVVLDLMLPDGNGIEFLRTVRLHDIPVHVAVLTGANDPKLLAEVRAMQPERLLFKPLQLELLLKWLEERAKGPVDGQSTDGQ